MQDWRPREGLASSPADDGEARIASLLDDPENLREMHSHLIERREARKAARRWRKGRYQLRSMRM